MCHGDGQNATFDITVDNYKNTAKAKLVQNLSITAKFIILIPNFNKKAQLTQRERATAVHV